MKKEDFEKTLHSRPKVYSVFKISKAPEWATGIQKGDLGYCPYENNWSPLHGPRKGVTFNLGCSYLSFVTHYVKPHGQTTEQMLENIRNEHKR